MSRIPPLLSLPLCLTLGLAPLSASALSTDRDQPMYIEANEAELDDQKGISIYRGDVKVTQGSMVVTGDIMTVYNQDGDIDKIVVEGQPATHRQRPDNKDEDVRSESLIMHYFPEPERVVLMKEAVTWQGKDVFRSERIVYDIATDRVRGGSPEGDKRVHITLQPRSRNAASTPGQTEDTKNEE